MKKIIKYVDKPLLIVSVLLFIIGLIMVFSASNVTAYMSHDVSPYNYFIKQGLFLLVGLIMSLIMIKFTTKAYGVFSWGLLLIIIVSLLMLLVIGQAKNRAISWYDLGPISIQPSEFMKIFIMLVLAVMISNFRETTDHPSIKEEFIFILKTLIVVLIPSVLTFLEPDTGAVMIYFIIYFCMMFTSGIRLRWFVILGVIIAVILGLVLGCYFLNEDLFVNIFGTDLYYRFDRILDWQNGSGLQLENALAAIGSAGFFGHGFNQTPIYFPESSTDFIFAVYASNFGLLGVILLLCVACTFAVLPVCATPCKGIPARRVQETATRQIFLFIHFHIRRR